ncbi:phosphorothioated DNA-binding restriction endonuclease [Actinophytocola sp.]|uniref:phosphorothioated DNA-binding restriction endonuclease n=1 Tax=Actinophytocola sp. TaxID=1872138 RepID=UPI0032C22B8C
MALPTEDVLARLATLRQHQSQGKRSPHKPLLVLLALGRLVNTGSSALPWPVAVTSLADLIQDYGPPSSAPRAQSAAYPFTRLRTDGVWILDHDVPMDRVRPLADHQVVGRLEPAVEQALRDPAVALAVARQLVEAEFPPTVAPDVLAAVGLDPEAILTTAPPAPLSRRRDSAWPATILTAWDRQCAFCGFDGQLGSAVVGIEAAHIRWFNFDGPDDPDNGLALCSLHHKLFDRGALGLTADLCIQVSRSFSARTDAGRAVYELDRRTLRPRPGTTPPSPGHVDWHTREVFKSPALR